MDSEQLEQYADYYQKHLRQKPDNVEARLRLATVYRELGRREEAVEAYTKSAELLADRELPLEAIAACKAVLELEPGHMDAQFFLAKLYASHPDLFDGAARVAQPVGSSGGAVTPVGDEGSQAAGEPVGQPMIQAAAGESDEDLRQTTELEASEREGFSRSEMEELLTTVDIGPEDIVDIEEIGDIEGFEEEYGGGAKSK